MTVIGPFNAKEWGTLKNLRVSIADPKIAKKRKEKEQFLYKVLLGRAA